MLRQSAPFEPTLAAAAGPWWPTAPELALVAAGALLVAWLWRRGVLTPGYLRGTPRRLAALGVRDLVVVVCSVFLGQALVVGAMSALRGPDALSDPTPTAAVTLALQLGTFGPATAWVLFRARGTRRGLRRLGVFARPAGLWSAAKGLPVAWLLSAAVLIVSAKVAAALGRETSQVQHSLLESLQANPGPAMLVPIVISAVVIAPVCEEVLTRGLLQTLLLRWFGRRFAWTSVAVASAAFTMLHVEVVPPQTLPGLFVLGLVFGALYERTGSLVPGILVHAAFNALNVGLVSGGFAG